MTFNPLTLKTKPLDEYFTNVCIPKIAPYSLKDVHPFTRLRLILMCGTEFEAVKFSHQFSRSYLDNDVRRSLAQTRRLEQMQQKILGGIKPIDESILVHTIGYEQLAVELTCVLAKREKNGDVKNALDFALLEDFDHLYRYSDLLDLDEGVHAETIVGELTEIMPGRPTVSEPRHPFEAINKSIDSTKENMITVLNTMIITAAEQQTMNYYMNVANLYNKSQAGRNLYNEIAMIEEQHVSEYGSLMDADLTYFENNVMHEYCEAYLYYSMYMDETDPKIKLVYEQMCEMECAHLKAAIELLNKYDEEDSNKIIMDGTFPELLKFSSNVDYVRNVISNEISKTKKEEKYVEVSKLDKNFRFFDYNEKATSGDMVATHNVIEDHISKKGEDYRYEKKPHPIKDLQDRKKDNISIGR